MTAARVLIVEDEFLIRWSLAERLRQAGFDVVEAENLAQARAAFNGEFAAVLLDLGLPDGNGLEFLPELLRRKPDCPVIVMTAWSFGDVRSKVLAGGARSFVEKPFDVDALVENTRQMLMAG